MNVQQTHCACRGYGVLYHQWRTYQAEAPIIINTSNTGTGKTKAALLRLKRRAEKRGFTKLNSTRDNVLFVAPTNELVQQHAKDARAFCEENILPYRVNPLTREALDLFIGESQKRRGFEFASLLRDSSRIDQDFTKRADLWVVNPDIFYYAITFRYNQFYRGPLFDTFFGLFNYLIFDEFHYYDAKQLAAFLFFIKLSQQRGYIGGTKERQFCILTATPRREVRHYLESLGEPIAWIEPGVIASEDQERVEPTRALAPVQLTVYSTDELQDEQQAGGLCRLVRQERETIRQWLARSQFEEPMEGAVISSALGMISRIHQELLAVIDQGKIGRITGGEKREGREEGKEKALILATPTVDIGYNFERSRQKRRQNIDFLLFDADFFDEFTQRLGRAGRVLGKEQQDILSHVSAVVSPAIYDQLRQFDGATITRTQLSELAAILPSQHDLFAYLRSGAILEIFRPFILLEQGMADTEQEEWMAFLNELRALFARSDEVQSPLDRRQIRAIVFAQDQRQKWYHSLQHVSPEVFDLLLDLLKRNPTASQALAKMPEAKAPLEAFSQRIKENCRGQTPQDAFEWLQKDLRTYFIEKARSSFREGFQPPLALVYDPQRLHSSREIAQYDALHFVRNYHLHSYPTLEAWHAQAGLPQVEIDTSNATAYFLLQKLRDQPLQLCLELDARPQTQASWEETFTYQLTSLYGLRIIPYKDSHGLPEEIQSLFRSQHIPAFVLRDYPASSTRQFLQELRKKARFYSLRLAVIFSGKEAAYLVILGTMAFHVYAEMPRWALARDRRKPLLEDDSSLIF